jgi:FdhD protein
MRDMKADSAAVTTLPAIQISTGDSPLSIEKQECAVAVEEPITIDVDSAGSYTVMCSPSDTRALVIGFLFSEGMIEGMEHLDLLEECADSPGIIRVKLSSNAPGRSGRERNLLVVSSCGLCGTESLEKHLAALPHVGDTLRISGRTLRSVAEALRSRQPLFKECGGTHAAGIFSPDGEPVALAEDIGRHNALDKTIGKCLLASRSPAGLLAMLSGRISLEMVAKSARAGLELVAAVSAPTSYAISAAQRCGITLCAFVRESRATIFTHPHRIEEIVSPIDRRS